MQLNPIELQRKIYRNEAFCIKSNGTILYHLCIESSISADKMTLNALHINALEFIASY